nr:MAG TPA: hypothetical protein [Caudoviricetes sp.]
MNMKTFFKDPLTSVLLAIQAVIVAIAIAIADPVVIIFAVFGMAFIAYLRLVDMRMAWMFDMVDKALKVEKDALDRNEKTLEMLKTCNASLSRYRDLLTMFREGLIIGMASADDETAKSYRAWVEAIDRALKDELKNFKAVVKDH